ncbi:MAG: hypothetical protein AB7I27_18745 [Bacteriovoracaceae bacterium]
MKKRRSEVRDCFCALCRSPRKLRYSRTLKPIHYAQIIFLSVATAGIAYPWVTWKGVFALPIIWAIFETNYKSLYRKDLICQYCGFDPTWYKKDVKLARRKVEEFLRDNPQTPILRRKSSENSHSVRN